MAPSLVRIRFRVIGMDCAHDAAEIEHAVRAIVDVARVRVSVASHVMTVFIDDPSRLSHLEAAVAKLGYQLDRMNGDATHVTTDRARNADEVGAPGVADTAQAYRRALWIVVVLNLGFGAAELAGGILARSQSLQADALDFLGDGLITLLALLALAWRPVSRARVALAQGLFLAILGAGVVVTTSYRVFVRQQPEAEVMGVLGMLALAVNVAAALALLPHRGGDTNARAVWLFSRNDALGNAAVVAAAALVAWTGTPWPDLAVAVAIAGLFLHSAWAIIRDASADLREAGAPRQVPPVR